MNLSNKWIWDYVNRIKTSVQICNQIRCNSSNTRVIVFQFIRPESPDFHEKIYILPPYWIRRLKIWIYNRLQWSQKSPSNSYQANRSKKIPNLLNFEYVTTIFDLPFLVFKVWLQNHHHQPQKPRSKSFQVNYSKRIQILTSYS